MNLFENLQKLQESENNIVSEFKEFLASKNAQYIANEIGETKDGMQIVIYDGDWKHEHLYMKHLLDEFFTNKGIDISITSEEIGESDQDTYSAVYDIEFNAKPKTYTADVKSLKFTTEDIEDSYNNDGLITELRTNIGPHNEKRFEVIQDGTLIFHSTDEELARAKFNKISKMVPKEYKKVDGKYKKFSDDGELASIWENVDTSNWKQRFKGMDVYISDKYPNYQIKKSYTSSKQEVWQVLNFKTQREVFVSGTFEGAIEFVEKKSKLKESIESNSFQIGEKYKWSGLYGGSYTGIVKEIEEDNITLDVSWTAEDTGKLITKELTYDLETDSEGNVAFIVWRYSGEKGYVYPKNTNITESVDIDSLMNKVGGDSHIREIIKDTKEAYPGISDEEEIADMSYGRVEDKISFEEWINIISYVNETLTESVDINLDDYEYIGPATGYNKGWSLYRKMVDGKGVWVAEHQQTKEIVPINYDQVQGFEPIKLDGIKKLQKDLGDILLPKQEAKSNYREPIKCLQNDKGDYINVYKDKESGKIRAEGDIVGSSFNGPWSDKDEEYYLNKGFKEVTESNDEDYDDNAATFLDTLEKEIKEATHKFMLSVGFPEDEADEYTSVSTDINDDYVMVAVGAELGYDSLFKLCQTLDKVIAKHDKDAYFEPECPGRIVAYLFGVKEESPVRIEEANKIDIISIPWPEYLNKEAIKNKEISKEISDIANNRSTVFSSDIVKQYVIDAVNEYIETHSQGFNDEKYRDSLYTQNDEKHFIEMGKQVLKLIQDMPIKNESLNESNHINIDDRDYATGEEMYRELVNYLNSLDQIDMDGDDCNWQPSEFNAKNLNADGEIYLECGAYILIYPYINEWAEDYFKVVIVDAENCELSDEVKNGIEKIFNKFKTDKWQLKYEG